MAYLFRIYNDDIFVGRLSIGLVYDFGDAFAHCTRERLSRDEMVNEEKEMGNQVVLFKGHPDR